MQKTAIAFVALPLAFAAAGYAGGQVMPAAVVTAAPSEIDPPGQTPAAQVLDELADKESGQESPDEGAATPDADHSQTAAARNEANVVRLGRMSVPVYRAHSVTYVVSEIGVEMRDTEAAAKFSDAENTSRLRDAVLASLHRAAEGLSLTGERVETPRLAETLVADLRDVFGADVAEGLLLSLLQAEVPRS